MTTLHQPFTKRLKKSQHLFQLPIFVIMEVDSTRMFGCLQNEVSDQEIIIRQALKHTEKCCHTLKDCQIISAFQIHTFKAFLSYKNEELTVVFRTLKDLPVVQMVIRKASTKYHNFRVASLALNFH